MSPQKNVHITPDKVERIKVVCTKRRESRSDMMVIDDLKKFIKSDLRRHMLAPNPAGRWEKMTLQQRQKLYAEYEQFDIKVATLNRAFNGTGITRSGNFFHLEELLELYLEEYEIFPAEEPTPPLPPAITSPPFSPATISALSLRAAGLCSSPHCWQLTSGPSISNPSKAHRLGVVCLIHGLQPGDPRYIPGTRFRRDDIENGIWLCANHAQLVNENEGDYTAELLIAWKQAHELLMQACLEGKKRITISLNPQDEEPAAAAAIIAFFDKQQVLYAGWGAMPKENIIVAMQDIGSWLLEQSGRILFDGRLIQQVSAIDRSCDAFLGIARNGHLAMLEYGLAALTKVIGMVLYEMATHYKMELPANVRTIIPGNNHPH